MQNIAQPILTKKYTGVYHTWDSTKINGNELLNTAEYQKMQFISELLLAGSPIIMATIIVFFAIIL